MNLLVSQYALCCLISSNAENFLIWLLIFGNSLLLNTRLTVFSCVIFIEHITLTQKNTHKNHALRKLHTQQISCSLPCALTSFFKWNLLINKSLNFSMIQFNYYFSLWPIRPTCVEEVFVSYEVVTTLCWLFRRIITLFFRFKYITHVAY